MKNTLLLCLLLAGTPALAQTAESDGVYYTKKDAPQPVGEAEQAFKGANTVVIHTPDSAALAFRKAGRAIVASGYSPTEKDNDLLYLLTGFRPIGQGAAVRVAMRVSVTPEPTGAAIAFTGTFANAMADMWVRGATPITSRAEYRGNVTKPWAEVLRVADACQCGRVTFARRP